MAFPKSLARISHQTCPGLMRGGEDRAIRVGKARKGVWVRIECGVWGFHAAGRLRAERFRSAVPRVRAHLGVEPAQNGGKFGGALPGRSTAHRRRSSEVGVDLGEE